MAPINLVFQRTRAKIGSIELDVSIAESHASANEVTDHPVEEGTNVVDHIRPKPDILKIEGLVSNTPLPAAEATAALQSSRGYSFQSRTQVDLARAGTAYEDLLSLSANGTLVTVVTGLRTYESMAIESLDVPRDAKTGQTLRFSCVLKHVRLAVVQTVKVIPTALKPKGKVSTKTVEPESRASTLRKGSRLLGDKPLNYARDLMRAP